MGLTAAPAQFPMLWKAMRVGWTNGINKCLEWAYGEREAGWEGERDGWREKGKEKQIEGRSEGAREGMWIVFYEAVRTG